MNHYVYQIISMTPDENGVCRIYSGLRSCEGEPEEDDYMGSGIAISRAIDKYGREKFMKIIIGKFSTREEAHDCETAWLEKQFKFHGSDWKRFKTFNYNLRLNEGFNDAGSMSPETRAKLSAANSGENNPFFSKQFSDEHKKKLSAAKTGENNPFFGKQHSDETKKKMRNSRIGKQHSDETKKKLRGENNHNFKGLVIGTNTNNQTIVFSGGKDMKARGFDQGTISKVILGKLPHHKGFVFIRTSDHDQLRELLNTAEFVDEESKQRIEEVLNN